MNGPVGPQFRSRLKSGVPGPLSRSGPICSHSSHLCAFVLCTCDMSAGPAGCNDTLGLPAVPRPLGAHAHFCSFISACLCVHRLLRGQSRQRGRPALPPCPRLELCQAADEHVPCAHSPFAEPAICPDFPLVHNCSCDLHSQGLACSEQSVAFQHEGQFEGDILGFAVFP